MEVSLLKEILLKDKDERTASEVKKVYKMMSEYDFAKKYFEQRNNNQTEIFEYCRNISSHKFQEEDRIYESDTDINLIIIEGSANLYNIDEGVEIGTTRLTFLKTLNEGQEFGSNESLKLKESDPSINKLILISNQTCEICLFKEPEPETKLDIKIKLEKNMTEMEKFNDRFTQEKTTEIKQSTGVNLTARPPDISMQEPLTTKTQRNFTAFDPEIFLIDDPEKLSEVLDAVKMKVDKEFKIFNKYRDNIDRFSNINLEISSLLNDKTLLSTLDSLGINNLVENKFKNYTDESKLEIKLGFLISKSLNQIDKCNIDIKSDIEEIKNKLFSTTNHKNKNMIRLNLETELGKEEFKRFIIDKINKEGKLNSLLEEKSKNEKIISTNKMKIKRDEKYLLDSFYCLKCHIRPRNAISKNCHHLVACDECMQKTKVCPRCGIDVGEYEKIYRS